MSTYSMSVALRASMALGSQPGEYPVRSPSAVCGGGTILQRRRNDPRWSSSVDREVPYKVHPRYLA